MDILQMSRVTTNQAGRDGENESVVWMDIGPGTNTVRLDNVGFINGGVGVRLHAKADLPAGEDPGRPLFVLCNDLEIDFPSGNAVELLRGESFILSNGYIQGSLTGSGIFVGPDWNSEVQVTNTRIFGMHLAGVELGGGVRAAFSNNIIGDNSQAGAGVASGVLVREHVTSFLFTGNHIGPVAAGSSQCNHRHGIEVMEGDADVYSLVGNIVLGSQLEDISDGGRGASKAVANNVGSVKAAEAITML